MGSGVCTGIKVVLRSPAERGRFGENSSVVFSDPGPWAGCSQENVALLDAGGGGVVVGVEVIAGGESF